MKVIKKTMIILTVIILIATIAGITTIILLTKDTHLDTEKLIKNYSNVEVFDANYSKLEDNSELYVSYSDISPHIISAFIAIEDKRFFTHNGLDYKRIASALIKNITSFKYKEGASTISQQLIKNTHLNADKTISRKLKEAKLALELEKNYSKENIMELYLNAIYFGSGIYGIGNACKIIFGIDCSDASLSQSTSLAGIVKNPKKYSPLLNLDEATKRRDLVLKVMLDNNMIEETQYNTAINSTLITNYSPQKSNYCSQYYTNAVDEASEILGISDKELRLGNYQIYTYMDSTIQNKVFSSIASNGYNPHEAMQLGLVIDNNSRGVTAYHSNTPYILSKINRQYASLLKPFSAYALAIENNNWLPSTIIEDEAININGYSPQNHDKRFHGRISMRESLMHSYNIPAIKALQAVGTNTTVEFLRQLGFDIKDGQQNLTLALGSISGSPLNITSAYAMLANQGEYKKAHFVSAIYGDNGKCLYSDDTIPTPQLLSVETSYMLTDMLGDCATKGTAAKLKYLPYKVAAKTGTVSNDSRQVTDVWTCAYSSDYTTLVWQGDDNKKFASNYGGGGYPTLMVKDIMMHLARSSDFVQPDSVQSIPINREIYESTGECIYDKNSTMHELFTTLNAPEINDDEIGIMRLNDQLCLSAYAGANVKIYRQGWFGVQKLIYDNAIDSNILELESILTRGVLLYKYIIVVDNLQFEIEY